MNHEKTFSYCLTIILKSHQLQNVDQFMGKDSKYELLNKYLKDYQ